MFLLISHGFNLVVYYKNILIKKVSDIDISTYKAFIIDFNERKERAVKIWIIFVLRKTLFVVSIAFLYDFEYAQ